MPSESSLKHQADAARSALKNFNAIRLLDAPGPVKAAVEELVAATAEFHNFIPFFVNHSLFLEIPPLVYSTLEEFFSKNPNFEKPALYSKIVGLNARVKDTATISAKKGMSFYLTAFVRNISDWLLPVSWLAAISAANLRPEKKPRAKVTTNVSPLSLCLDTPLNDSFI